MPTVSLQAQCHISVSFSSPSTCLQRSQHRQDSGLGMSLGKPNSKTRNELKVDLHARYLAVVLDSRVPVVFSLGLEHRFTPRSSRQASHVCAPQSWPCSLDRPVPSVESDSLPLSLDNFCTQVSYKFDVRHLQPPTMAISVPLCNLPPIARSPQRWQRPWHQLQFCHIW